MAVDVGKMNNDMLVRLAYGVLWLHTGTCSNVHEARRLLMENLTKEEQARGIEEARLCTAQPLDQGLRLGAEAGWGRLL